MDWRGPISGRRPRWCLRRREPRYLCAFCAVFGRSSPPSAVLVTTDGHSWAGFLLAVFDPPDDWCRTYFKMYSVRYSLLCCAATRLVVHDLCGACAIQTGRITSKGLDPEPFERGACSLRASGALDQVCLSQIFNRGTNRQRARHTAVWDGSGEQRRGGRAKCIAAAALATVALAEQFCIQPVTAVMCILRVGAWLQFATP